jgi:hypothetical protein
VGVFLRRPHHQAIIHARDPWRIQRGIDVLTVPVNIARSPSTSTWMSRQSMSPQRRNDSEIRRSTSAITSRA